MDLQQQVRDTFQQQFGKPASLVVRAPGRVNLIGDHTDYNDGFVLPMAIDRALWVAASPREDERVCIYSKAYEEKSEFNLDYLSRAQTGWLQYVQGVAHELQRAGHALHGWQGVLMGDLPTRAGLSSSAALELTIAHVFIALAGSSWDTQAMATLCQRAENQWVGVNCGIMDQLVCAAGVAQHALLIDCRSLQSRAIKLPENCAVVVLDTGVQRPLLDSAYNERRAQCQAAAKALGVATLRDISFTQFERDSARLPSTLCRRAQHVITENERVLAAATALECGDSIAMGNLMTASHASLRDEFEVSCDELNVIVNIALSQRGCFGARLTGAGFGGCAIALVATEHAREFSASVCDRYLQVTGLRATGHICLAANGASVVGHTTKA